MQKRIINKSYTLTEDESLQMKNDLLAEMDNNDVLQVEYERVKLEHRQIIKQSDDLISQLRSNIKSGTKEVQVEISYNYPENGKKTLRRTDTGEETIEDMLDAEVSEYPCEIPFVETEEMEKEEETEEQNYSYNIEYLALNQATEEEPKSLEASKSKYNVGDYVRVIYAKDSKTKSTILGTILEVTFDSEQDVYLYTVIDQFDNVYCVYQDEIKEVIKRAEAI